MGPAATYALPHQHDPGSHPAAAALRAAPAPRPPCGPFPGDCERWLRRVTLSAVGVVLLTLLYYMFP